MLENINRFMNGSNFLWWFLSIIASIIASFTVVLIIGVVNRFDTIIQRITQIEINISKIEGKLDQVDDLVKVTRIEQVSRTEKFGTMNERLSLIESSIKVMDLRLATMSERILTVNRRLDGRSSTKQQEIE
jgi:hypothetical protein